MTTILLARPIIYTENKHTTKFSDKRQGCPFQHFAGGNSTPEILALLNIIVGLNICNMMNPDERDEKPEIGRNTMLLFELTMIA